jgi:hypothetical protein
VITAWVLYAILLGTLAFLAAVALERAVAVWNGARRFVWLAALIAATAVPALLAMGTPRFGEMPPAGSPELVDLAAKFSVADPVVRSTWLILSALAFVIYIGAMTRLRFRERRWRTDPLNGEPVLVADDFGPAVVGVFGSRIVVPQWAFELDARSRRLMLRHEEEHIRTGDPQLLFIAALALVLTPWNPALWLIVARLRLCIEVDCDARVLLDGEEGGEYGNLLLAVCARRAMALPLAASLAEHTPDIERRIIAISDARPDRPLLASLAFAIVAAGVITIAATTPRPASLRARQLYSRGILALPGVTVTGYLPAEQSHAVVLDTTNTTHVRAATSRRPGR